MQCCCTSQEGIRSPGLPLLVITEKDPPLHPRIPLRNRCEKSRVDRVVRPAEADARQRELACRRRHRIPSTQLRIPKLTFEAMATFSGGAPRAAHPPPAGTSILSCSRRAAAAEPRRAGARAGGTGGGRGAATAVSMGSKRRERVSNFFEFSLWHLLRHCPGHDVISLNVHSVRRLCLLHVALVHSQSFALRF